MKRYALALCLAVPLACVAGCSSPPRIDLALASQPNINPDHSGRPSPVIVKTFELRTDLNFKQADFQSLFDRPVQVLGADLVAADEMVLIPGEARKIAYSPHPETKYLGVIGGFRQMERSQWRMIKAIDAEKETLIALEFNDASILTIPEDKAGDWNPEESVKKFQQQLPPLEAQRPPLPQAEQAVDAETVRTSVSAAADKAAANLSERAVQQGVETAAPTATAPASAVRAMIPIK